MAVRLLAEMLPYGTDSDLSLWPVCDRLLPHALAVVEHASQLDVEPVTIADLIGRAAAYLHARARCADAASLHERAPSRSAKPGWAPTTLTP